MQKIKFFNKLQYLHMALLQPAHNGFHYTKWFLSNFTQNGKKRCAVEHINTLSLDSTSTSLANIGMCRYFEVSFVSY